MSLGAFPESCDLHRQTELTCLAREHSFYLPTVASTLDSLDTRPSATNRNNSASKVTTLAKFWPSLRENGSCSVSRASSLIVNQNKNKMYSNGQDKNPPWFCAIVCIIYDKYSVWSLSSWRSPGATVCTIQLNKIQILLYFFNLFYNKTKTTENIVLNLVRFTLLPRCVQVQYIGVGLTWLGWRLDAVCGGSGWWRDAVSSRGGGGSSATTTSPQCVTGHQACYLLHTVTFGN